MHHFRIVKPQNVSSVGSKPASRPFVGVSNSSNSPYSMNSLSDVGSVALQTATDTFSDGISLTSYSISPIYR